MRRACEGGQVAAYAGANAPSATYANVQAAKEAVIVATQRLAKCR